MNFLRLIVHCVETKIQDDYFDCWKFDGHPFKCILYDKLQLNSIKIVNISQLSNDFALLVLVCEPQSSTYRYHFPIFSVF